MSQIAVVLAGCGVYDGTEVHEAAAALGRSYCLTPSDNVDTPTYQLPCLELEPR